MIAKVKPTCKLVHPKNAISGRENKLHEYAVPMHIIMPMQHNKMRQRRESDVCSGITMFPCGHGEEFLVCG